MQRFITFIIILCYISPCLCMRLNTGTKNVIYNVMDYDAHGDGKSDDTQAFASAWGDVCKTGGTLVIPAQKIFLVMKIIFSGPCQSKIRIQFEGKIVAPPKKAWKGGDYLISIKNLDGLIVDGNGNGGASGDGSTWWHCQGCDRPGVFYFHSCKDLTVSNILVTNSPSSHISVNMCNGATFSRISINSPATSPNTDGDDCIAINGGSSFINATRVTCGPGHGISVGSLGKKRQNDHVSHVYVRNCTFIGTLNGGRIKTSPGGSGYAKQITFEQIILNNVRNPIVIDQKYKGLELDTNVVVEDATFRGFIGSCSSDIAINLDCSSDGCHGIILDQNNIVSTSGKKISAICNNAYGNATNTIPRVSCLRKE